jgi:putative ABC transport system permease protein
MFFAEIRSVAGDYLATMGIPILPGRNFLPEEMSGKEKTVIINQTMARSLWKEKDPIEYRLRGFSNDGEWFTVVGVVRDVHQAGLGQPIRFLRCSSPASGCTELCLTQLRNASASSLSGWRWGINL